MEDNSTEGTPSASLGIADVKDAKMQRQRRPSACLIEENIEVKPLEARLSDLRDSFSSSHRKSIGSIPDANVLNTTPTVRERRNSLMDNFSHHEAVKLSDDVGLLINLKVKEISKRYTGNSLIESQEGFYRRLREQMVVQCPNFLPALVQSKYEDFASRYAEAVYLDEETGRWRVDVDAAAQVLGDYELLESVDEDGLQAWTHSFMNDYIRHTGSRPGSRTLSRMNTAHSEDMFTARGPTDHLFGYDTEDERVPTIAGRIVNESMFLDEMASSARGSIAETTEGGSPEHTVIITHEDLDVDSGVDESFDTIPIQALQDELRCYGAMPVKGTLRGQLQSQRAAYKPIGEHAVYDEADLFRTELHIETCSPICDRQSDRFLGGTSSVRTSPVPEPRKHSHHVHEHIANLPHPKSSLTLEDDDYIHEVVGSVKVMQRLGDKADLYRESTASPALSSHSSGPGSAYERMTQTMSNIFGSVGADTNSNGGHTMDGRAGSDGSATSTSSNIPTWKYLSSGRIFGSAE